MDEFIIVLGVGKPYDIEPEGGGEHVTGCTMWYLPAGEMTVNEDKDTGALGHIPVKERMGVDFYKVAQGVGLPAKAKVQYGMKNSAGKQVLYLKGVDFVAPIKK
jgi:hypothetical protein